MSEEPFDFADLRQNEQIEKALHGDLRPLVALLRSDEPLTKQAREYIAAEIEREPDKRFRRQKSEHLNVREADRMLLYRVFTTKLEMALRKFGADADDDVIFEAMDSISDPAALDYLCENYGLEINQHDLDNALRRSPPGIFDPRGPKRQARKMKL